MQRNRGLDMLRVVAILMIICHHCIVNNFGLQNILLKNGGVDGQTFTMIAGNSLVILGVNLFFLISGYFGIRVSEKKIIRIIVKVYIITFVVIIIGLLAGTIEFNRDTVSFLVDPCDKYWYVMTYIFLMLISPLLNKLIDNMNKSESKYFVILFAVICCFYGFIKDTNLHINNGYSFLMAMALYFVGGIIRRYIPECDDIIRKKCLYVFIMLWTVESVAIYVTALKNGIWAWHMYSYNQPFIVVRSVLMIIIFRNINLKSRLFKIIISALAPATLMTYLLHSTCWLQTLRAVPIEFVCNNYSFEVAFVLLPAYAIFILLIGFIINEIYERTFGRMIN